MRRAVFVLLLLLAPPCAFAVTGDCSADVATLNALYHVRDTAMRYGPSSYEVREVVDGHLDAMREPLGGGEYRWVRWVRPTGEPPVTKKEHLVSVAAKELEPFEASASRVYAVRIVVPKKRSLFRGNNEVYVSRLAVRYVVDGREKSLEKKVEQWLPTESARSFDLGGIASDAEVTLQVAARGEHVADSLVEVHFLQAVPEDDRDNPNFEGVNTLKRLGGQPDPEALENAILRYEALLFPDARLVRLAPLYDLIRDANKLLASDKEEERKKGREKLKAAEAMVKPDSK